MSTPIDSASALQPAATTTAQIDPLKLQHFVQEIKEQQNLFLGLVGGLVAAGVAAVIWAVITAVTKYQIGFMAIGVGFLVGFAVRQFGRGIDKRFGVIGGVLALLGCVAGNLLALIIMISAQEDISIVELLFFILAKPLVIVDLFQAGFAVMDLLFYGIAVYEGYKFSFRTITQTEAASVMRR